MEHYLNQMYYVRSLGGPGFQVARVVAVYPTGWAMMWLEQAKQITFMMPLDDLEGFEVGPRENLTPSAAIPEIQAILDKLREEFDKARGEMYN